MEAFNQNEKKIPSEYKPIGAWGYVGYNLLFSIPLVGLILIIIFAAGGASNINVKNYARSFLCVWLILLIIAVIVSLILIITGGLGAYMLKSM